MKGKHGAVVHVAALSEVNEMQVLQSALCMAQQAHALGLRTPCCGADVVDHQGHAGADHEELRARGPLGPREDLPDGRARGATQAHVAQIGATSPMLTCILLV